MPLQSQRRSNVRRANVTACVRCRSRKQRCDQALPACHNCEVAGVDCVSVDIDGRVAPRSYVKKLEDRVAHLEKVLISHGISDYDEASISHSPRNSPQDAFSPSSSLHTSTMMSTRAPSILVTPLTRMAAAGVQTQSPTEMHTLLEELPYETRAAVPSKDASQVLTEAYFEHTEFFSPILQRDEFFQVMEDQSNDDAEARFRVMMVYAVAGCLLNRKDPSFPTSRSEAYYATAMRWLADNPALIQTPSISHLTNLSLTIQYCMLQPNLTAAWYLLGFATRMVVEMGLHQGDNTAEVSSDTSDERRWLFWAVYCFERILCNVTSRPFSIPDEAITTPLPEAAGQSTNRRAAIHVIKHRRLLSEIHQTIIYNAPYNGATLDYSSWRKGMRQRLQAWYLTSPKLETYSQLNPKEFWDGTLSNTLVLLYFPWPLTQAVDDEDLPFLAEQAAHAIEVYRLSFREGKLRYYWRTLHHLFRAGAALVYCIKQLSLRGHGDLPVKDLKAAANTCSAVLWGMVERHHSGHRYRDMFETLLSSLDDVDNPTPGPWQIPFGDFQDFVPMPDDFAYLE